MDNYVPTAYGYARASGATQETSVENQHQVIHRYFKDNLAGKYKWGQMFSDDGVSAFRQPFDERPGGRALWTILKPGDAIVFTRHDRLIRSVQDGQKVFDRLRSRSINAISIADGLINLEGAGGRINFAFWSLIGQATSELISDRTKEAKQALMMRGEMAYKDPPAGYKFKASGEYRPNGKKRVLVVPAYGDRKIIKRSLIDYVNGKSLCKIEAEHWVKRRKGEITVENDRTWFNQYFSYAWHCYILGWPSTFYRSQYRGYMKEAVDMGILPATPHRERLLTSLENCQEMILKSVDLSVKQPGRPHILPVISGLALSGGSQQFPKTA